MPGAQQLGHLAREMGFAHPRRAQQEHGRDLQRVAAVGAQGQLAAQVVQHLMEVGQLVVQVLHGRQAGGFDLEALGPLLQHALVCGAQGLMIAGRQLAQAFLHRIQTVDMPHVGNRDAPLEVVSLHRDEIGTAAHISPPDNHAWYE